MPIWMVSYECRTPGRNYTAFDRALRSVPFARILDNVWLIEIEGPAKRIRDILRTNLDANDRIMVVEFRRSADWALGNVKLSASDWVKLKRP